VVEAAVKEGVKVWCCGRWL